MEVTLNDARRHRIKSFVDMLEKSMEILESVSNGLADVEDDEQDAIDSMPENLQCSDMCDKMEHNVDVLTDAGDAIGSALEGISCVTDKLLGLLT